jgi:hypothetical protein
MENTVISFKLIFLASGGNGLWNQYSVSLSQKHVCEKTLHQETLNWDSTVFASSHLACRSEIQINNNFSIFSKMFSLVI